MYRSPQDFGKQKKREAVKRLSQGKSTVQPARRPRSASAGARRARLAGNAHIRDRQASNTLMPSARPNSSPYQQPPNLFHKTTETPSTFQPPTSQFTSKQTPPGVDTSQSNPFLASLKQPVASKDDNTTGFHPNIEAVHRGNPFLASAAATGVVRPPRSLRKRHHSQSPPPAYQQLTPQFGFETTQSTPGSSGLFAKAFSAASKTSSSQYSSRTALDPYVSPPGQQEMRFQMGEAHENLQLSGDVMMKTSLHVKRIPYQVNTKPILLKHFGRFGKVVMVSCYPAKLCATVAFDSHAAAARAKKEGKIIQRGSQSIQFQLFWNQRDQSNLSTQPQYSSPTPPPPPPPQTIVDQPKSEQEFLQDVKDETDIATAEQPTHGFRVTIDTKTGAERLVFKSDDNESSNLVISAFCAEASEEDKGSQTGMRDSSLSIPSIQESPSFSLAPPHYNTQPFSPLVYSSSSPQKVKTELSEDSDLRQFIRSRQTLSPQHITTSITSTAHQIGSVPRVLPAPQTIPASSSSLQSVALPSFPRSISTGFTVTTAGELSGVDINVQSRALTPPPLPEMAGESAQERYEALRERDAKMRQGIVKDSSLSTAKIVKGTCPDMCPETERYMRLAQHELKSFEMTETADGEKTLDHAKAIKEYSRSSADKEEPLPHELRPPHVLNMTMDYLLTNVMDKGNNRWPQWFDFVWNRTRAIRKDLTQQQICSPLAVSLVEKTTRFHAFVAHQLCEEELLMFDPKINDENLTKCLQTLKQYYTDLRQTGVKCLFEPEFQCYTILMNLDQGDVLREVLTFPQWVRDAPNVVFALQVHAAFNSNNYVRFLRLIRKSSYLEACILHRYLTQLRVAAVKTMERAYTMAKRMTAFPLPDFVQLLAFEDVNEAVEFCHHYSVTVDNDSICLEKDGFTDPNKALPVQKSWHLIESKRPSSVGELVQAGQLPSPPTHIPHSSFDPSYRAKTEQFVQSRAQRVPTLPSRSEQTAVQSPPESLMPVITDQMIELLAEDCIDCGVRPLVEETARQVCSQLEDLKRVSINLADEICSSVESRLIRATAEETMREATVQREKIVLLYQAICSVRDELLEEMVTFLVMSTATTVYRDALDVKHLNEARERACKAEADSFLSNCIGDMVKSVAREAIEDEKMIQKEQLAQITKNCLLLKLNRFFHHWLKLITARHNLRERLRHFPVGPSLLSPEQQLFRLKPSADSTTKSPSKRARIPKYLSPFEQEGWLRDELRNRKESLESARERLWHRLDLSHIADKYCCDSYGARNVYWQLCVLTPDTLPDDITKWLMAKFSGGREKSVQSGDVQTWYCDSVNCGRRAIHVCCKHLRGVLSPSQSGNIQGRYQFYGTQSIVFVVDSNEGDINWQSEANRLYSFCQLVPPSPGCSVLVLIPEELTLHSQTDVEQGLGLSNSSRSIISCKTVVINLTDIADCKNDSPSLQLESAIQLLATTSPSPPKLKCETLYSIVESGISQLFDQMVSRDDQKRKDRCLGDQNPDYVVGLFNSVIEYLSECCAGKYLRKYSWPIPEFSSHPGVPPLYWNSAERLTALQETVLSLQFPLPSSTGWSPELEWLDERAVCLQYVQHALSAPRDSNSSALALRIHQILSMAEPSANRLSDSDSNIFSAAKMSCVPWTHILILLASHRMAALSVRESVVGDDRGGNVYYEPSCCCRFEFPAQWVRGMSDTFLSDSQSSCTQRMDESGRLGFPGSTANPSRRSLTGSRLTRPFHVLTASTDTVCSAQSSAVRLSDSLTTAMKESDQHNLQLEAWLESGSFVITCHPVSEQRQKQECQETTVKTKNDGSLIRLRPEEELSQRLQGLQRLLNGASWFESWEERSLSHSAAL